MIMYGWPCRTFDGDPGLSERSPGDIESLTHILSLVLFTNWFYDQRTIIRHREPTIILARKHQNLKKKCRYDLIIWYKYALIKALFKIMGGLEKKLQGMAGSRNQN